MKTTHTSHGIIPIYEKDDEIFICAVHNEKSDEWGLPKGTPENNETPIETASRELEEETGITEFKIIGGKTFSEKYNFEQDNVVHNKTNIYFVASVGEMFEKPLELDSKDMKWINIKEAENFFKFDTITSLLNDLELYLNK